MLSADVFAIPVLFNIYLHDHGTAAEARTKMVQGLAGAATPNFWNTLGMKPLFRFLRENAATAAKRYPLGVRRKGAGRSSGRRAAGGHVVRAGGPPGDPPGQPERRHAVPQRHRRPGRAASP